MAQEGIPRYLVPWGRIGQPGMNTSGKPWRVAIQNRPTSKMRCRRLSILTAMASAPPAATVTITSSTGSGSHVIDPQTGRPITHNLVSVTVIAPTALEADAGYRVNGARY